MFAWLPLLASLANLFALASGQPEEARAILKMPIAEVSVLLLCINFPNLGNYLNTCLKLIRNLNKQYSFKTLERMWA